MPKLPASERSGPSRKWMWLTLVGLIMLCAASFHRKALPFAASKHQSGDANTYNSLDDELLNTDDYAGEEEGEAEDELVIGMGGDGEMGAEEQSVGLGAAGRVHQVA